MENGYGLFWQSSGVWRALRDGDFEEEDVWSVLKERTNSSSKTNNRSSRESALSVPRHVPTAARMIPKAIRGGFESSNSSINSSHEGRIMQQSAPVSIPNWPNSYRHKSKKASRNASWYDDDHHHDGGDDDELVNDKRDGEDHEEEDDYNDDDDNDYVGDYDCKVPPHEFISRRLARSQISSFSVFEGVGRTLKGRDLSNVRNAMLTKIGFIE
ncbi:protein S40-7-like [Humulus lupulus]|uniref:protein S40-7-like n=1 Tax=Humulus lupulus TaxID=3486 RepID=UPI002B409F0B|nr:protein S40-7-like [Humulus lupulus]